MSLSHSATICISGQHTARPLVVREWLDHSWPACQDLFLSLINVRPQIEQWHFYSSRILKVQQMAFKDVVSFRSEGRLAVVHDLCEATINCEGSRMITALCLFSVFNTILGFQRASFVFQTVTSFLPPRHLRWDELELHWTKTGCGTTRIDWQSNTLALHLHLWVFSKPASVWSEAHSNPH